VSTPSVLPDGCGAQVAALLVHICGRASALSVTPPIVAPPHVLRYKGTLWVLYETAGVLKGYSTKLQGYSMGTLGVLRCVASALYWHTAGRCQ
jgi:hypothetical protein